VNVGSGPSASGSGGSIAGLLAERDVAQRRAEKAEEVAEEPAAEPDALRAFHDVGKILFTFVLFPIFIVVFCVQQRSINLNLIKLNKDSDRRMRIREELPKMIQAGDDLVIEVERIRGKYCAGTANDRS